MIVLEHVSKHYGTEKAAVHAVDDVSLHIQEGDIFGVIGFSGAGKSTLVRCINLLERPDGGHVYLQNQDLTTLGPKALRESRKKIGMIFQHFNLLSSRTVLANIAFPLKGSGLSRQAIKERALELLSLVGLPDKANAYPAQLSGGQKQRVAIARALANAPKVLLCDEATSALDPQTTQEILVLLRDLNQRLGLTIVLITHEMAVVKEICNKVAVMEAGRVVEEGDVFDLFVNPREAVSRNFIRTSSNLRKIDELIKRNDPITLLQPGEMVVRLSYIQRNVSEPLISAVSRLYGVDVNIIFANIEMIQGASFGGTVAIFSGETDKLRSALDYLKQKNVGVEVLKDAGISQ